MEFMEQEDTQDNYNITVFDLPCGSLVRFRSMDEDTEEKTPDIHEWTEADRRYIKRGNREKKKQNEALLKLSEALTDEELIHRFAERSRGLQTHFAYFSAIADAAINNKWVIGYATYRKRMKKEDILKEHRSLKNWLHKNGKDSAIHMVASPAKVSTKNTALMPKARAMLCLRVRDVAYNRRLICANGKTGGLRQSLSA